MKTAILLAAATNADFDHTRELPFEPIFFGLIALGILLSLMFVTMSWKGIAHRH